MSLVETGGVVSTDAGMCGLWNAKSFREIVDYDTWEEALLEDQEIARHIIAGAFVPVNVGGDGASRWWHASVPPASPPS